MTEQTEQTQVGNEVHLEPIDLLDAINSPVCDTCSGLNIQLLSISPFSILARCSLCGNLIQYNIEQFKAKTQEVTNAENQS